MTVCANPDESGGTEKKPRKTLTRLSNEQWVAARFLYESGKRSVEEIMAQFNVAKRTVRLRIATEGWKKGLELANGAESKLHSIVEQKLEGVGEKIAERIGNKVEADLQPWFEQEKRRHVKHAIKLVKSRQRMVDNIVRNLGEDIAPKDAAYIAKSDDTYDAIGRRNLGMNDSTGLDGALSVRVLTQGAAIEIQQS